MPSILRSFIALALLIASTLGAPNPWGSYLDWDGECWSCQDAEYERCGGGVASINEMAACVCVSPQQTSFTSCLEKSCADDSARVQETLESYCARYITPDDAENSPTTTSSSTATATPTDSGSPLNANAIYGRTLLILGGLHFGYQTLALVRIP